MFPVACVDVSYPAKNRLTLNKKYEVLKIANTDQYFIVNDDGTETYWSTSRFVIDYNGFFDKLTAKPAIDTHFLWEVCNILEYRQISNGKKANIIGKLHSAYQNRLFILA